MSSSALTIQVERSILLLRDQRVMLDFQLAELYQVETRALKQAVRRNIERFPADFMFELSADEINDLVSQNVIPGAPPSKPSREMGFHAIPKPKSVRKPKTSGN